MEQTSNTFSKGLQMDTHPMVQGNDTLSDALNATFVTQNGNEVILQNDMGNRKIDNAYLPAGYLPVGMKEYGGIIYVAAYNPITNKSLIGSFPSPERRIGEENENLGNTLNLINEDNKIEFNSENSFLKKLRDSNIEDEIYFLKDDTILIPLTSDTSLHAGDKFSVYSSNIWSLKDYITNFLNTLKEQTDWKEKHFPKENEESDENYNKRLNSILDKIFSPKNKLFTLQLGILNSLNEFVDITKSLERWDGSGREVVDGTGTSDNIISFDENESELYKFNKGYFIANQFFNSLGEYAGNDTELIAERQQMAVNTYAYKLVGPLYLKATLNHILDFSYTIEGVKTREIIEDKLTAEITITGTITYNCPDGIEGSKKTNSDIYFTFETGTPTFEGFTLKYKTKDSEGNTIYKNNPIKTEEVKKEKEKEAVKVEKEKIEIKENQYDESTNLYKVVISKTYDITATDGNNYDYYLCVPASDGVYLEGLSTKGTIDISKLGSGELKLTGWRFNNNWDEVEGNNNCESVITYTFDSYPKPGHKFKNLRFAFVNVKEKINDDIAKYIIVEKKPILIILEGEIPTRGNYIFNWNSIRDVNNETLENRKLYKVYIYYDDESSESTKTLYTTRFFLTTNLFDDCYYINNVNFMDDYEKFMSNYTGNYVGDEEEIRNNKLKITPYINISFTDSEQVKGTGNFGKNSSFFKKNLSSDEILTIEYNNKYIIVPIIFASLEYNKMLYPDYIPDLNSNGTEYAIKATFPEADDLKDSISIGGVPSSVKLTPKMEKSNTNTSVDKTEPVGGIGPINYTLGQVNKYIHTEYTVTSSYITKPYGQLNVTVNNLIQSLDTIYRSIGLNPVNNISKPWISVDTAKSDQVEIRSEDDISKETHSNMRLLEKKSGNILLKNYLDLLNTIFSNSGNKLFIAGVAYDEDLKNGAIDAPKDPDSTNRNNNGHILRVWIRCNNQWALIGYKCNYPSQSPRTFTEADVKDITDYFIETHNIYYSFKNSPKTIPGYFKNDLDYSYTKEFNIPVNIKFNITAKNENITEKDNNWLSSQPGEVLTFICEEIEPWDKYRTYYLKSNSSFDNYIKSIIDNNGEIQAYSEDLDTLVDGDYNPLIAGQVYIEKNGALYKKKNNGGITFIPDSASGLNIPYFSSKNSSYAREDSVSDKSIGFYNLEFKGVHLLFAGVPVVDYNNE